MAKGPHLRLERRRFARSRVCLDWTCTSSFGSFSGVVRNLSVSGAFVESSALLPPGTKLRFGVPLPGEPDNVEWMDGRVVHVVDVVPTDSPPGVVTGMGVQFETTPEQRERLTQILHHVSATPPARGTTSSRTPSRPAIRPGVCADEARLRLDQLRPGQSRSVRLRLVAMTDREMVPTDFFLDVKVFCWSSGDRWNAEVKADFGDTIPSAATLTLLKDRYEAGSALPLVAAGRCVEQEMPLPVDPGVEKIIFWVVTDGAPGVPERMACAIRLKAPAEDGPADDLDTMRLPSVKTVVSRNLAEVLRESPDPRLSLLGELMESHTLVGKVDLLRRLVQAKADLRLIEAGVRDVELWERMAKDFGRIEFDALQVHCPAGASLIVFHPHSAPHLLARALVASFHEHVGADHPDQSAFWRRLALAAGVALCRRDRAALDEAVETARRGFDAATAARLATLVDSAGRKTRMTPVDSSARLGDYADDIRGRGDRKPLDAAVEFMAAVGFVALTIDLEC